MAIWSPNTHHWVLAAFGALSAGATLVPVSTRFTGPEALDVITRSGASVLIVADRFLGADRFAALRTAANAAVTEAARAGASAENHTAAERLPVAGPLPGRLRLVVRVPMPGAAEPAPGSGAADGVIGWADLLDRAAAVPASAAEKRAAAVHPGDVSDILFTSGTTGRSKGAMTAHRQSLAVARAWAECGGLTSTDRYLVVNPFFHSFGYKAGILACLVSGATLVPQLVYDAGQAMSLVASERITVLPGPPTIYQTILDHPGPGRARSVQPAARGHRGGHRAGRPGRADAPRADLRSRAHCLRADRGGGGDDVPPR